MKILYVDLLYDYGDKTRGLNLIGQEGFKSSFEKLGHDVVPFYYDDFLSNLEVLQQNLLSEADKVMPDLIFFCLFENQFEHETLVQLKNKYTTVNWFGDDQWRFDSFTKFYASDFTWCVTTDLFSVENYKKIDQPNVILSQWAAIDTHVQFDESQIYKYDVSFVGGYHPYREWFIKQLGARGINVEVFGNGWGNGPLSAEAMMRLFAESKINLNISNSNSYDIRYLFSSLRAFSSSIRSLKSHSQIKARNFEIPFFGGFQLSDYVPGIEQYYDLGKEIVCYSSVDDAALQIKYYLSNDFEREEIRKLGNIKAKKNHGYSNRFKKVFRELSLCR
ncbi:CgeB family protein [Hydrogenovibrio marinus]|uniref:Spore protein YkvP/CgeB glycosyl transferase-like domain-containing protein n=1 Tax=Hydrogenovibrio marinus TaxID=28885 RepID=A0A066ZWW0_HYDMR|nr:glycosyltransferase [Hydrogenovibrio marinus]KDN96744.1 hypothetical protein EI16_10895 [Hydrogenovibrio marinus]BBN58990.1 hypothetical protein HVMH_0584 [Hydrogenovibrio marinus]